MENLLYFLIECFINLWSKIVLIVAFIFIVMLILNCFLTVKPELLNFLLFTYNLKISTDITSSIIKFWWCHFMLMFKTEARIKKLGVKFKKIDFYSVNSVQRSGARNDEISCVGYIKLAIKPDCCHTCDFNAFCFCHIIDILTHFAILFLGQVYICYFWHNLYNPILYLSTKNCSECLCLQGKGNFIKTKNSIKKNTNMQKQVNPKVLFWVNMSDESKFASQSINIFVSLSKKHAVLLSVFLNYFQNLKL